LNILDTIEVHEEAIVEPEPAGFPGARGQAGHVLPRRGRVADVAQCQCAFASEMDPQYVLGFFAFLARSP